MWPLPRHAGERGIEPTENDGGVGKRVWVLSTSSEQPAAESLREEDKRCNGKAKKEAGVGGEELTGDEGVGASAGATAVGVEGGAEPEGAAGAEGGGNTTDEMPGGRGENVADRGTVGGGDGGRAEGRAEVGPAGRPAGHSRRGGAWGGPPEEALGCGAPGVEPAAEHVQGTPEAGIGAGSGAGAGRSAGPAPECIGEGGVAEEEDPGQGSPPSGRDTAWQFPELPGGDVAGRAACEEVRHALETGAEPHVRRAAVAAVEAALERADAGEASPERRAQVRSLLAWAELGERHPPRAGGVGALRGGSLEGGAEGPTAPPRRGFAEEGTGPGGRWDKHARAVLRRVMVEMIWHHGEGWCAEMGAAYDEAGENRDSASHVKARMMGDWAAGTVEEDQGVWRRVDVQRRRFGGSRQWQVEVRESGGERRVLVLVDPPPGQSEEQRREHARRQATYQDDSGNRFGPGWRLNGEALAERLRDPELVEGIRHGFKSKRVHAAPRYHGTNYGGAVEMQDLAEEQLQKERGRFNEGPLLYVPWIVQPLNGIYYPAKNKFRLIWDARKSGLNDSIAPAPTWFDLLREVVRHHRPGDYMSGWDMTDAFRLWPKDQVDCDELGMRSPATGEYDRARYAVFGARDSPAIQGAFGKELKAILTEDVAARCEGRAGRPGSFEVLGVWVDDGHQRHDGALTQGEADAQFRAVLDACSHYGVELAEKKHSWPSHRKEYTGVQIDTELMMAGVTAERSEKLRSRIADLEGSLVPGGAERRGVRVLSLRPVVGEELLALAEEGVDVVSYATPEPMTGALAWGLETVGRLYPTACGAGWRDGAGTLPRLGRLSERHVRGLGEVDIVVGRWRATELEGTGGRCKPGEEPTGLVWEQLKVLEWARKYNPGAQFHFEMEGEAPSEVVLWLDSMLCSKGAPLDAADVSAGHQRRWVWSSRAWRGAGAGLEGGRICLGAQLTNAKPSRGGDRTLLKAPGGGASTWRVRGEIGDREATPGELARIRGWRVGDDEVPPEVAPWVWRGRDVRALRVSLPRGRGKRAKGPVDVTTRRAVAKLAGELQFCAEVVLGGQAHLWGLYRARDAFVDAEVRAAGLRAQWRPEVEVRLLAEARADLAYWSDVLQKCGGRRFYWTGSPETSGFWDGRTGTPLEDLINPEVATTREGAEIVRMDASGFQGGAMWGTERVGHLFGERDRAPFRSANWRELYMPLVALRKWGDRWRGRRVLVVTDSDVTRSVIARQGSRAVDLNDLYKEIALECARWEVDLAARHIPGKENVEPDNISRWAREFDRSDWMFRSDEVEVIEAMTGPHAVDSHADVLGLNALMPMHWHRRKPAELQDWRGLLVWCNGDYADLGPALRRFWECQRADASGGATFVVPFWPTAPWWRWLKGFKLLRWYPEGTPLFQRPDWARLELPEGGYGLGAERVWGGGTQWPVLIAHCPGVRRGTGSPMGVAVEASADTWAGMPELRGEGVHDTRLLREMQPIRLPQLRGAGGGTPLRVRTVSRVRGETPWGGAPAGGAGASEGGGARVSGDVETGLATGRGIAEGVHQPDRGAVFSVLGGHVDQLVGLGTDGADTADAGCIDTAHVRLRSGPTAFAGGEGSGRAGAQPPEVRGMAEVRAYGDEAAEEGEQSHASPHADGGEGNAGTGVPRHTQRTAASPGFPLLHGGGAAERDGPGLAGGIRGGRRRDGSRTCPVWPGLGPARGEPGRGAVSAGAQSGGQERACRDAQRFVLPRIHPITGSPASERDPRVYPARTTSQRLTSPLGAVGGAGLQAHPISESGAGGETGLRAHLPGQGLLPSRSAIVPEGHGHMAMGRRADETRDSRHRRLEPPESEGRRGRVFHYDPGGNRARPLHAGPWAYGARTGAGRHPSGEPHPSPSHRYVKNEGAAHGAAPGGRGIGAPSPQRPRAPSPVSVLSTSDAGGATAQGEKEGKMEGRWAASLIKRPTVGTEFHPFSNERVQRGNARGAAGVASRPAALLRGFQPRRQPFSQQPLEQQRARAHKVIEIRGGPTSGRPC